MDYNGLYEGSRATDAPPKMAMYVYANYLEPAVLDRHYSCRAQGDAVPFDQKLAGFVPRPG